VKESTDLLNASIAHLPASHVFWEISTVFSHDANGDTFCPWIFAIKIKLHSQKNLTTTFLSSFLHVFFFHSCSSMIFSLFVKVFYLTKTRVFNASWTADISLLKIAITQFHCHIVTSPVSRFGNKTSGWQ